MTNNEELINRAIIFAVNAHDKQKRKGSGAPYILHPLEAASIASTLTLDAETLAAVVLHDTVEDCGVTEKELTDNFGARVSELVLGESENKRRSLPASETWTARKEESLKSLKETDDKAVKIMWLADKLSNIRSLYAEYRKKGDAVWELFNQKDKRMHEWYYRTVVEYLSEFSDETAYKELSETVEKVFG